MIGRRDVLHRLRMLFTFFDPALRLTSLDFTLLFDLLLTLLSLFTDIFVAYTGADARLR